MKSILGDFLLMIQFFTRIPIKRNLPCNQENFRRGIVFLPLIGFLIGVMQYGFIYLLKEILPSSIVAIIATLIPIIITGALHIDGLGDTFDGFFAFTKDKHRIIEIMKDSHVGTFAISAIIANMLLQYSAIEYLITKDAFEVLLVAIMFSKLFVILTGRWGKPAKAEGSGNLFVGNMSIIVLIISIVYSLLIGSIIVTLLSSLILLFAGVIVSILFYVLCYSKIEGVTGDTFGALQELTTVVMLVIYCIII